MVMRQTIVRISIVLVCMLVLDVPGTVSSSTTTTNATSAPTTHSPTTNATSTATPAPTTQTPTTTTTASSTTTATAIAQSTENTTAAPSSTTTPNPTTAQATGSVTAAPSESTTVTSEPPSTSVSSSSGTSGAGASSETSSASTAAPDNSSSTASPTTSTASPTTSAAATTAAAKTGSSTTAPNATSTSNGSATSTQSTGSQSSTGGSTATTTTNAPETSSSTQSSPTTTTGSVTAAPSESTTVTSEPPSTSVSSSSGTSGAGASSETSSASTAAPDNSSSTASPTTSTASPTTSAAATTAAAKTGSSTTAPNATSTSNGSATSTQSTGSQSSTGGSTATTTTNAPETSSSTQSSPTTTTDVDNCNPDPCVNGTCADTGNDYSCTCTPGFTGKDCSIDIDDCVNITCQHGGTCTDLVNGYQCNCKAGYTGAHCETDIDDCADVTCKNGGTCEDLVNDYRCNCSVGWTGEHCETNIDDCADVTCKNGGTCEDLVNDYRCNCSAGWTGEHCETNIDECESVDCENGGTCKDMLNNYTCDCIPGWTGRHCEINIDDCAPVTCHNGGSCKDLVNNFTCECASGWEGRHCDDDIDECITETHECHSRANCTNTEGDYNCTCIEGFQGDGRSCSDIDECEGGGSANCSANAMCFNMVGTFRCICEDGWTGQRCESDIDECAGNSKPCSSNATCTNADGSFSCECNDGFRGDGFKCIEEVLFPIPHDGVRTETGDDEWFGPYSVSGGLPYQEELYYNIYVSMNGYITLGRSYAARYPPRSSASWKSPGVPIIAPLWTDLETKSPSGLSINANIANTTYLQNIVDRSNGDLHNPRFGFMATWKKAVPYPYDQNNNYEYADFQAVIVTNGSKTLVIFNYDREIYTWDSSAIGRYINIGYTDRSMDGTVVFNQSTFTQANEKTNTGVDGRWVFDVSETNVKSETEAKCQAWLSDVTVQEKLKMARDLSEACPCSYRQAIGDGRFRFRSYTRVDGSYNFVFTARFYQSPHNNRQKCHYDWRGSLVRGFPGGGYLETKADGLQIEQANGECCSQSTRLCRMFYKSSPSDSCRRYRPPLRRPSWGDPHIRTLDGMTYTFNGRGEYILVKFETIMVQARTELADASSTDATIFVGLAVRDSDGDTVELALDTASGKCNISVNGVKNATFPGESVDIDANKVSVSEASNTTDNSLVVALESGVSIQVTVSNILDFVTSVSGDATGQASGLMGDFGGTPSNAYVLRNATVLQENSSEEVLFQFGTSWNIKETESLFNYSLFGKNFSYYNNETIRPKTFVGDVANNLTTYLSERCPGRGITESAINASCGNNTACIIDASATCNISFGERTKKTEETVEEESKVLDNEPPVFHNDDTIHVRPDSNISVFLNASDTNTFSFSVHTNIDSKSYTFENGEFMWNVEASNLANVANSVYLKFIATDELNATSEYWPNIYYCGCNNYTECDDSELADSSNDLRFYRAKCNCTENMKGDYCNETVDACDPFPCFEGVACNSTKPASPCGECPSGYEGDGTRCNDKDECRLNISDCSQVCKNELGSYSCSCDGGYTLGIDNRTCTDINECTMRTDNCAVEQTCWNQPGSFQCRCKPGYMDSNGTCVKQQKSFVMKLVITVAKNDQQLIKDAIINWLTGKVYKTVNFISIDVTLHLKSSRRRRDTSSPAVHKYDVTAVLHSNNASLTTADVQKPFNKYKKKYAVGGVINPYDSNGVLLAISATDSEVLDDKNSPLCQEILVACDPLSTACSVDNGRAICTCKPGFEKWLVPHVSCKDIDECQNAASICVSGNCTNTLGSYNCQCQPGYRYDGTTQCQDMCQPSPCQNGGECIHGNQEAQYVCKCDDKWAGANCERENEETTRLKTIAIIVGGVVGGVCLLLLLALFGVYRRSMSRKNGYTRHADYSLDDDFAIPRANLNRSKDVLFDDDNTTFSIPRPKLSRQEHEMTDLDAQSNGSNREDYTKSKGDEGNSATQPLAAESSSSRQRLSGKENPSFLHGRSTANLRRPNDDYF